MIFNVHYPLIAELRQFRIDHNSIEYSIFQPFLEYLIDIHLRQSIEKSPRWFIREWIYLTNKPVRRSIFSLSKAMRIVFELYSNCFTLEFNRIST